VHANRMSGIDLLLVAAMVAAACAGNLLLKLGAISMGTLSSSLFAFADWKLISGFALFVLAAFFYLTLLRRMPLNVAQSLMALQFVAVILSSCLVLHEPLPPLRLAGVCVITVGVLLVALSHADHG
jgi:drug/metabolite transporter (DMT)-like permease